MDNLTSRFLSAYNQIDELLRSQQNAADNITFSNLVRTGAKSNRLIKKHKFALLEFSKLRNFLVHRYDQKLILASPTSQSVERLEKLANSLASPEKLIPKYSDNVVMCAATDPIGKIAQLMREKKYSQVPVVREGIIIDLLTAHTIAMWLAATLSKESEFNADQPVAEVLPFSEDKHSFIFINRNANIIDALSLIEKEYKKGNLLQAILVTEHGKPTEKPMGILTLSDLPALRAEL
tara:strand:+ start:479 stop:1186 length:708 start_codon:yes stop_codon:yes gene_type:complete